MSPHNPKRITGTPKTFVYTTPDFTVRPFEVICPRCNAGPWDLCYAVARKSQASQQPHPQRVALAQRLTRYHVYEMSGGRLVKTFGDTPNAVAFAHAQAQRLDVEDIDAGTVLVAGVCAAPPVLSYVHEAEKAGLFVISRFHREVQP